jgi:lysozyme
MPLALTQTQIFVRALRGLAMAGAALALASCAQKTGQYGQYGQLGDAKPHPAVTKAHKMPVQGIDVSRWQGKIDWASVAAGRQAIRLHQGDGGRRSHRSSLPRELARREAGRARPRRLPLRILVPDGRDQARWFKRNVPNDPGALPPVLDVEWNNDSKTCPQKVDKETALSMIRHMLDEMERHTGKRPIIYTDINFHNDILEGELLEYPHWIRSTAAEPHVRYGDRKWTMWQYTTTGRVRGSPATSTATPSTAARRTGTPSCRTIATRATPARRRATPQLSETPRRRDTLTASP